VTLEARQPYWRERGGLSETEREALERDVMPPSAIGASRRWTTTAAPIAAVCLGLGGVSLTAGVVLPGHLGQLLLIGGGSGALLGAYLAFAVRMARRRGARVPLTKVVAPLRGIREKRYFTQDGPGRGVTLDELVFDEVAIEIPLAARDLVSCFEVGRSYRVWYLPATAHTAPTFLYAESAGTR